MRTDRKLLLLLLLLSIEISFGVQAGENFRVSNWMSICHDMRTSAMNVFRKNLVKAWNNLAYLPSLKKTVECICLTILSVKALQVMRNFLLILACDTNCSSAIAKILIAIGADVNAKDNYDFPVLSLVCRNNGSNQIDTMKILIEAQADVNAKDNYDCPVLSLVCRDNGSNQIDMMKILVEARADINAKDNTGKTPLMNCVDYGGMIRTAQALLETVLDPADNTGLKTKASRSIDTQDNHGDTALSNSLATVCSNGDIQGVRIKVIELLLQANAQVDVINDDGKFSLEQAVKNNRLDLINMFLAKGASIDCNIQNNQGYTALTLAKQNLIKQEYFPEFGEEKEEQEIFDTLRKHALVNSIRDNAKIDIPLPVVDLLIEFLPESKYDYHNRKNRQMLASSIYGSKDQGEDINT